MSAPTPISIDASPMHRLWDIPELVQEIMTQMDNGSLFNAILTCRAWFDPAASVLWAEVSTRELFYLVSKRSAGWSIVTYGGGQDTAPLSRYARFVRWLCIRRDISDGARYALLEVLDKRRTQPFFPILRIASLEVPDVSWSGIAPSAALSQRELFFLCLSPSVAKVILSLNHDTLSRHDYLRGLMGGILSATPQLRSIQLQRQFAFGGHREAFLDSAAPLYHHALQQCLDKSLDSIRSFSADLWALDPRIRQDLASLPSLETLRIKAALGNPLIGWDAECARYMTFLESSPVALPRTDGGDRTGSDKTFPVLRVLELEGTSGPLEQILALTPSVVDLSIVLHSTDLSELHSTDLSKLTSVIGAQCSELQVLSFTQAQRTPRVCGKAVADRILAKLRGCRKLRSLALHIDGNFDDDSLVQISELWPEMEALTLDGGGGLASTRDGLQLLLSRCNNLCDLSLRVTFPTLKPLPGTHKRPTTQRYIKFRPLQSLAAPPHVASECLYAICPNLHICDYTGWAWEDVAKKLDRWRV
ncbi:hypothetical protein CALCODRAFT_42002 [Calocera cornea HHB12733]|uniref:F-box domain-containing protein n=1 Tax=Calocera cornea HHB12733 TaxID=1353952 RepID=A0A165DWK8_9BASI|nr:hypothetical protein CALCODRAFT_42002 [Calocera cornea HHB12733]